MLRTCLLLLAAILATVQENQPQARGAHTLSGGDSAIHEEWELGRASSGQLRVTGHTAAGDGATKVPYTIELDDRLRIVRYRLQAPAGAVEVRLDETGYDLLDTTREGKPTSERHEIQRPFTLITSLAWALPRLVLAGAESAEPLPIILLMPDDPGFRIEELEGTIRFVGTEEITIRGTEILAERYELRSEVLNLDIWATDEGFVLAYQDAKRPEQRAEMTKFERLGELLPSLGSLSK